ncbi:MAG: GNAT family N-acetyltransferase [Erysipelotrichaceae bacterium]|nr:GNAT family N-acetyltransferase [Erysipelotrichaceae bacterium]
MSRLVLYVHGKGGSADESFHYRELFDDAEVRGIDYQGEVPWIAAEEIHNEAVAAVKDHEEIILIANSIGAYFAMQAALAELITRAYFISPILNMEKLIKDMMMWAGVSEQQLQERGTVPTAFGEDLSWQYLCWVRQHPVSWPVKTHILYGSKDNLTEYATVRAFADQTGADITVMENGEHWFHTEEQMAFLDQWIRRKEGKETVRLREPTLEYDTQIQAYRREFLQPGCSMDGGGSLIRYESSAEWLKQVEMYRHPETVPPDKVPASQYIYVREPDNKIVGVLQIRHYLNDYLAQYAGHIGYSVAPSERRKGYAERMLKEGLAICRRMGLKRVLITCFPENEGSRRTILKNGGVYEATVHEENRDRDLERYWIDLVK